MAVTASNLMANDSGTLAPELRALLDASPDAVLIVDRSGRIIALNRGVEALFGTTAERLHGQPVEVLLPEHARRAHAAARAAYTQWPTVRPMSLRRDLTALRAEGTEFPVEVSLTPVVGSAEGLVMAVVRDVSARFPMPVAGAVPERVLPALDALPDAILTTDPAGRLEFLNRAAERLTGWSAAAARGRSLEDVLPLVRDTVGERVVQPVEACLSPGNAGASYEVLTPGGPGRERRALDVSATPIRDRSGALTGVVVIARDVTHARLIARQLAHEATHDPLTGLVNRSEFERRLANALAGVAEGRAQHSVCFLDLDGFKQVNDACGHPAGDEMLRQLAEVMKEQLRSRDTLARLGGDEFGLLLEHCRRPQAQRIAEQVRKGIGGYRFTVNEHTYAVRASIGVVPLRSGMDADEVLRAADAACYLAKRRGGDRVEISGGRQETAGRRAGRAWSRRVLDAAHAHRFRLYAQPLLPLQSPDAPGPRLELLLRLEPSAGAAVPPRVFLPVLRRFGLLPDVDQWVVREAVRRLNEWTGAHPAGDHPRVAINLGEETVASGLAPALVQQELAQTGLPAEALCFEISEATVVGHPSASAGLLRRLRAAGCRTTIEHCGSGMAAFTMLRRLRPDYLKIAGHIVRSMHRDPIQHTLAAALNEVGHRLGLGTIAFQVEEPGTLEDLRRMGVDYAQGFGVGQAVPLEDALAKGA